MTGSKLNVWIEAALAAVISLIISFIPIQIGPSFGISLGVVGIFIVSFRRGIGVGILAGFIWGTLKVITGTADILTPVQGLLEYLFAFGFGGLAGIFAQQVQTAVKNKRTVYLLTYTALATFVAMAAQYFIHFLAGIFFWSQFAPEGMSAVYYSAIMNLLSGSATWLAGWLVSFALIRFSPQLVLAKKK
ncbi:energy-coupled thiamine transporter ThiT [Aerococcus kribbianus]|uniref:Energy-coupled thiamine transporter ThiT n=1 Tax=Aerococcus kribbianus TaxID=2999064 RepID=A0A9X3JEK2_9LACT|nr:MULTISPECIES: energy-coupled thiamine transporter ThiT [unclassified Aerococcus]MCZ0717244.1 energy-coupled thiamine transporter ThiT [Aerococcus sp. YH-aer221]MCZ0725532.1 energy-coupled thiamine transporter ThiT [Aerococcus sp. YH-aer222]